MMLYLLLINVMPILNYNYLKIHLLGLLHICLNHLKQDFIFFFFSTINVISTFSLIHLFLILFCLICLLKKNAKSHLCCIKFIVYSLFTTHHPLPYNMHALLLYNTFWEKCEFSLCTFDQIGWSSYIFKFINLSQNFKNNLS